MKNLILALLLAGCALTTIACTSGPPGSLPTPAASTAPTRAPTRTPTKTPSPTLAVVATPLPTAEPPVATPTVLDVPPPVPSTPVSATATAMPALPSTVTPMVPITGTVMVGAGHVLNVREAPSVDSFANNELAPGTQVTIVGKTLDEKWLQIDTPAAGWVSSDYVALSSGYTITGQMPVAGGYQSSRRDTETRVTYVNEPPVSSGNALVDWFARMIHQLRK